MENSIVTTLEGPNPLPKTDKLPLGGSIFQVKYRTVFHGRAIPTINLNTLDPEVISSITDQLQAQLKRSQADALVFSTMPSYPYVAELARRGTKVYQLSKPDPGWDAGDSYVFTYQDEYLRSLRLMASSEDLEELVGLKVSYFGAVIRTGLTHLAAYALLQNYGIQTSQPQAIVKIQDPHYRIKNILSLAALSVTDIQDMSSP